MEPFLWVEPGSFLGLTGFDRVLPTLIKFYRVWNSVGPSLHQLTSFFLGFIGFIGFYWVLPGSTAFHRVWSVLFLWDDTRLGPVSISKPSFDLGLIGF